MAFKSIKKKIKEYEDIESLFRDLNTSGIQSLYSHQADILRYYQEKAFDENNVAIELPTGSGKTLVGLLIAEFRRRKFKEKVLYLCPTRQLVNQVVELSNTNYGINSIAFTGSNRNYSQADKFTFNNGDAIGVTNYSSLFNTNPWFEEPDLIVLDDAHTSENYIASCWSLLIPRYKYDEIYRAVIDTLKPNLSHSIYGRLTKDDADFFDRSIVEKFPNTKLFERKDELFDILSTYLNDNDELKYSWSMVKDNLEACQLYYSYREILIRPLIPPSLANAQFKFAKQRIFMSATLGKGGDLERITGIKSFFKIPIPQGWDKQGMGRRFFMFPSLSLDSNEIGDLTSNLLSKNNRTVILVSSDDQVNTFRSELTTHHPEIEFFTALDIEKSKSDFINSKKAAIVLANRFDGIDFAGDQSRLLFLIGIPYASNLQEKFLQSRMSASIIFYDRNRTRLIQAIGRCTRSPKDYSAICVLGGKDLSEWLVLEKKNKYLHPELQGELKFGIENSKDVKASDFLDNFDEFIQQTENWNEANNEIIEFRNDTKQIEIEGSLELEKSAKHEVKFQYYLWNKQYKECFELVDTIIQSLDGGKELKGYRAFWNYQGGAISNIMYKETNEEVYKNKSKKYIEKLIRICPTATWARTISDTVIEDLIFDSNLIWNIEYLQQYLSYNNINHPKQYNKYLMSIEQFIKTDNIENLNLHIGKLLGFNAENPKSTASPDPYWISDDNFVIVFEDKFYDSTDGEIAIEHIRQAATHGKWIKENVTSIRKDAKIIQVLLSNRSKISEEGRIYATSLKYWNYDDFVTFSKEIISLARDYAKYYGGENDDNWKDFFLDEFYRRKLSPNNIVKKLKNLNKL